MGTSAAQESYATAGMLALLSRRPEMRTRTIDEAAMTSRRVLAPARGFSRGVGTRRLALVQMSAGATRGVAVLHTQDTYSQPGVGLARQGKFP